MVDHPPSPTSSPPGPPPGSTGWLRLFAWDERPEVEVHHDDGLWYRGRLRAWRRDDATGWRAMVTYHVAIGRQHYREVPATHVRRASPRPGSTAIREE